MAIKTRAVKPKKFQCSDKIKLRQTFRTYLFLCRPDMFHFTCKSILLLLGNNEITLIQRNLPDIRLVYHTDAKIFIAAPNFLASAFVFLRLKVNHFNLWTLKSQFYCLLCRRKPIGFFDIQVNSFFELTIRR